MKNRLTLGVLSAMLAFAPVAASAQTAAPAAAPQAKIKAASTQDEFVPMAAMSNMFEIESSRLALEKSDNAEIKRFAQHMIDDHTKAAADMEAAIAAGAKTEIPMTLSPEQKQMMEQLQAASGTQFDALYVEYQAAAHEQAIGLFEGFATSGEPSTVKTFAANTLPTLKMHQEMLGKLRTT